MSLGQEASPADAGMSSPLPPWLMSSPAELASIGIGFIPFVGTAASVYEVATGHDLVTGEEVHRGMALIGVVPGGKLIRAVGARTSTTTAATKPIGEFGPRGSRLTLRQRMIRQHGPPPSHMTRPEAHHDLPRKFRDRFQNAGLDIDDPKYGRWVEQHPHRQWSKGLNDEWQKFFNRHQNRRPTQAEILDKLSELQELDRFRGIAQ